MYLREYDLPTFRLGRHSLSRAMTAYTDYLKLKAVVTKALQRYSLDANSCLPYLGRLNLNYLLDDSAWREDAAID